MPAEAEFFKALRPLLAARDLDSFWFIRKDPDLRLRFAARSLPDHVEADLLALQRAPGVREFFPSVYEPEVFSLGGPACADLAHDYFARDSALFLAWQEAHAKKRLPVSRDVISLAVTKDFFERCIGPREEVWDAWHRVRRAYGAPQQPADIPPIGLADLEGLVGPDRAHLVQAHRDANERFAEGVDEAWRRGELEIGKRQLVVTMGAFHWNRFRIDESIVAKIADAMLRSYA